MAIKTLISGINMWKWGAILLLYVGSVAGAYYLGVHNERLDQADADAAQAREQAALIVEEVTARLPVVQGRDTEAAELRAQLRTIRGKLDEAIAKGSNAPECALTDDELQYFRQITESAR